MTINERIKEIRRSSGLSQTDFAERLGTTRGVITNLDGEMKQKLTRNQEIAEFMGVVIHDPDDSPRKRFVSIISKLSVDEWQLLAEIAKKMAEDG